MEKITKQELDKLMIAVQKGSKALGLFKDTQTARMKYPQYNYILACMYDEIYTSTIDTVLSQLSKLYKRSETETTLFTIASKFNNPELKKEFYQTKDSCYESQDFVKYMQSWEMYNTNLMMTEPDYFLPVNNAKKLLDFAEKYIREAGKDVGVVYGDMFISINSLTGLMDFVEKK